MSERQGGAGEGPSSGAPGQAGLNVLFISKQRLVGATNGSSTYLIDLARAVRERGLTPHLIQPSSSVAGRWPILSLRPEMAIFETHDIRGLVRLGNRFVVTDPRIYLAATWAVIARALRRMGVRGRWARDRPLPYAIGIPWTDADHRFLAARARGRADIVIADYMFTIEGLRSLPEPKAPSAIVMHDLFHARSGGGRDSVALIGRDEEFARLGQADAVIAIQAEEARVVRAALPGSQVILAPMAARPAPEAQPGKDGTLLFVGSNTAPNVLALEWLFAEVWPKVIKASPGLRLKIAGAVGNAFVSGGPEGVAFLGMVDDLAPLYAEAGLVISPLTFGSGLKIKLIEALAAGKAIVATPTTLQGVEAACRGSVVSAATAEAFADAILLYAEDREARARLAQAALETAQTQFSAAACYADFSRWLSSAAGEGR